MRWLTSNATTYLTCSRSALVRYVVMIHVEDGSEGSTPSIPLRRLQLENLLAGLRTGLDIKLAGSRRSNVEHAGPWSCTT